MTGPLGHLGRYPPMSRFSLRTLLFTVALLCVLIVISVWGVDTYKRFKFRQTIAPAWEEAPVCSTATPIDDLNGIVIQIKTDSVSLDPSPNVDLQKCKTGGDHRYDLDSSLGKFRVINYGNIYTELTSEISPERRPFDVIRDSLMLDNNSPASTAPLWMLRTQLMPIGCNTRLQHFETPHKMGIISGTISTRPNTIMFLFDSTGEYSIGILALEPKIGDWDELAAHVVLRLQTPGDGG